ncbi:MAG: PorT family protein [Bacteroidetes bacterium]|nr:PorT family protein [Bacteroidota bacterium]
MKKIALIAIMLVSFTSINKAQEGSTDTDNREKLQFGLKVGLNYSNVYDDNGEQFNADAKFGLAAGIYMGIPFGKYLGIQPGAIISQKGFHATGMILGKEYNFTRTTTYLDLPLLFTFKPSEFLTFVAGPQYSFLISQHDVFTNGTTTIEQEQEFKNDNIRRNIFGAAGGFDINLKHITLGARINCDLQNNNGDGTSSTPRYKNVWFQGTVGYTFYR